MESRMPMEMPEDWTQIIDKMTGKQIRGFLRQACNEVMDLAAKERKISTQQRSALLECATFLLHVLSSMPDAAVHATYKSAMERTLSFLRQHVAEKGEA